MEFTGERLVPDNERSGDLYHEHIVRYLLAAQLARGRRVLDAGCGAGYGSALLAQSGALSVLGIDIAAEAVDYARRHYQQAGLAYAVHDVTSSLPAAPFDLIVSFEVIEHLDNPAALARAAAEALTADGIFTVSTPNAATYPPGNPFHKHEMGVDEFLALLGLSFPALALFEQDYCTTLALRPSASPVGQAFLPDATTARPVGQAFLPDDAAAHSVGQALSPGITPSSPDAATAGVTCYRFLPAPARAPQQPDYYVAVCALNSDALHGALRLLQSIVYELPADRLGERTRAVISLQNTLEEKNAYTARLEDDLRRQGVWANGLEQQVKTLRKTWYVRLFGKLGRLPGQR